MRAQPAGAAKRLGERSGGRVAVLVGRERAERVGGRGVRVERFDLVERDRSLGERARLVEAHHVDACETFDRGQLLHEHLAAGERHGRDREREARQQHEALGHHRHDARDDAGHRFPPTIVRRGTG